MAIFPVIVIFMEPSMSGMRPWDILRSSSRRVFVLPVGIYHLKVNGELWKDTSIANMMRTQTNGIIGKIEGMMQEEE